MMNNANLPYDLKKNGYSVLCYGGHESMISELEKLLPGIRLIKSGRKSIDTSSFWQYDLVVSFITNCSHTATGSVRNAAKRANVHHHRMIHKGAETAAIEILESLGVVSRH